MKATTIHSCIIAALAMLILAMSPQPAYSQKWLKKIGKALDKVNEVLGNDNTSNNSSSNSSKASSTKSNVKKLRTVANTKTYNIDGGVDDIEFFSNGVSCIHKAKGGWLVMNKQGVKVFDIPDGYIPMNNTKDGWRGYDYNRMMAFNKSQNTAIMYDPTGKIIKKIPNLVNCTSFVSGVALICRYERIPGENRMGNNWIYIDTLGVELSETMPISSNPPGSYTDVSLYAIADGLARVWDYKTQKWGYRNQRCQWVIRPAYPAAKGFSEGLAAVKDAETGKWGFIDTKGNWVIRPQYTRAPGSFSCGMAVIEDKQGCSYYIDKTGKILLKSPDANTVHFKTFLNTGYAVWDGGNLGPLDSDNNMWIIDKSFKKLFRLPKYNSSISFHTDDYFVCPPNPGCWGYQVLDYRGKVLLEYNTANDYFYDGIGIIKNSKDESGENFSGFFNIDGEIIVKFKDTLF